MLKGVSFDKTEITSGFWKQKQDLVRSVTVNAVYDRFKETGRFDALKCLYKEGDEIRPHIFWDSDVAKWIEGAAYIIRKKRNKRDILAIIGVFSQIQEQKSERKNTV